MTRSAATTRQEPKTTHELKSWPASFRAALTGRKRFEVRRDDRSPRFQSGDAVRLREFDPFDGDEPSMQASRGYTGRSVLFFIGFIERSACLPAGWCAFDLVSAEDVNRADYALNGDRGL